MKFCPHCPPTVNAVLELINRRSGTYKCSVCRKVTRIGRRYNSTALQKLEALAEDSANERRHKTEGEN